MAETCMKCKQPTATVHLFTLDGALLTWLLCCLCALELINELNGAKEPVDG